MQTYGNRKLGFWTGRRVNTLWSWLISLVVIILSVRGIIVINSALSAEMVYRTTAVASLLLAICGFIFNKKVKAPGLVNLKNLMIINGFLTIFNVVVDLSLKVPIDPTVLYFSLGPYIVFLFLRVPTFYLKVGLYLIAIVISYSVCDNFIDTLRGPAGVEEVFEYNSKLRPEVFEAFSRTGEFYRVGGYTGNYHDSANILGMAASFLFVQFLLKRNLFDLAVFLVAMLGLLLTQSAANIIVAILVISFFSGYILLRSRKLKTYVYLLMGLMGLFVLGVFFGDMMSIFLSRVGENGDWEGMTNQLDLNSLLLAMPFILVGHAMGFGSDSVTTEIGFLKGILQWGVVHAIIIYWILIYPVIRFVKIRSTCIAALPSVAAICFGFLSLLHYGSLFRVTNIYLFFVFYAICLNTMFYYRNTALQSNHFGHTSLKKIV